MAVKVVGTPKTTSVFKTFFGKIYTAMTVGKFLWRLFTARHSIAEIFNLKDFPELYQEDAVLRPALRKKVVACLDLAKTLTPNMVIDDIIFNSMLTAVDVDGMWKYVRIGIDKGIVPFFYNTQVVLQGEGSVHGEEETKGIQTVLLIISIIRALQWWKQHRRASEPVKRALNEQGHVPAYADDVNAPAVTAERRGYYKNGMPKLPEELRRLVVAVLKQELPEWVEVYDVERQRKLETKLAYELRTTIPPHLHAELETWNGQWLAYCAPYKDTTSFELKRQLFEELVSQVNL